MAANQSRHRTDLDSKPLFDTRSEEPKGFQYQPLDLDPNIDSIRLVLIEPSINFDDPLSCRLIHVTFAERRKFKALSYMWGDEAVKEKIFVEEAEFYIGQNLRDALRYIRRSSNRMPFWIDAICINQNDIPERNRQLKMMKWIYFRAETVVVWLGKKYSEYQARINPQTVRDFASHGTNHNELQKSVVVWKTASGSEQGPETLALGLKEDDGVDTSNDKREMIKELCADEYWNRLWIIQEIGRANTIEVWFGNLALSWNALIELVTLHNASCEGPLRLNRLLQEKYSGSHTLRKLLQDHRAALCKEPKDKIYGLVGLAADAFEFPMDYRKSLIEVWKDTMEFMNSQSLLTESDIIPFGGLVKSLLIGANLGPLEQVLQPYNPRPDLALTLESPDSCRVFKLHGVLVGCIVAVGPSPVEIISSANKADQWAAKIQNNFPQELGKAHQENDTLMRTIIKSDGQCLASACFSHVSNVRWSPFWPWRSDDVYMKNIKAVKARFESSQMKGQNSRDDALLATADSHLFLVKNFRHSETPWKMGIVSDLAEPGDLVCWVPGIERGLVLRVTLPNGTSRDPVFQVFGTALFTDDIELKNKVRHASNLSWFREEERMSLKIDSATIYVLLA